jgi:hypothetical protein
VRLLVQLLQAQSARPAAVAANAAGSRQQQLMQPHLLVITWVPMMLCVHTLAGSTAPMGCKPCHAVKLTTISSSSSSLSSGSSACCSCLSMGLIWQSDGLWLQQRHLLLLSQYTSSSCQQLQTRLRQLALAVMQQPLLTLVMLLTPPMTKE